MNNHQIINRKRQMHVNSQFYNVRNALHKQFNQLAEFLDYGNLKDLPNQIDLITSEPLEKAYKRLYLAVGKDFAAYERGKLKALNSVQFKADPWDELFEEDIINYVNVKVGQRINTVTGTNKEQILKIVKEAITEGEGVIEPTKKIRRVMKSQYGQRAWHMAMRISNTETTTASSYASQSGARSSGIEMMKVWDAGGVNVRDEHWAANGEKVNIDDYFILTGEELMMPGDPSGSAWNVINCKCVESHEPR